MNLAIFGEDDQTKVFVGEPLSQRKDTELLTAEMPDPMAKGAAILGATRRVFDGFHQHNKNAPHVILWSRPYTNRMY